VFVLNTKMGQNWPRNACKDYQPAHFCVIAMTQEGSSTTKEGFALKLAEEPPPDMMSIMAVIFGLMGLLLKVSSSSLLFLLFSATGLNYPLHFPFKANTVL
jgi:hypothetical protein